MLATILVPEQGDWHLVRGRTCRQLVNRRACKKPAILGLMRGSRSRYLWCYCEEHSFGRIVLSDAGIYYAYEREMAD